MIEIVPINAIDQELVKGLYELFQLSYSSTDINRFTEDLFEKDYLVVQREQDTVLAFSTVAKLTIPTHPRVSFIFSGDTASRQNLRMSTNIFSGVLSIIEHFRQDDEQLYWILLSKGWRTYRLLPSLFHSFHPTPTEPTDKRLPQLLQEFMQLRYGEKFNAKDGILPNTIGHEYINTAEEKTEQLRINHSEDDPYTRLFLKANPMYRHGDELACIAPLHLNNYKQTTMRLRENPSVMWLESETV